MTRNLKKTGANRGDHPPAVFGFETMLAVSLNFEALSESARGQRSPYFRWSVYRQTGQLTYRKTDGHTAVQRLYPGPKSKRHC